MAEQYGIKETSEALTGMRVLSVAGYKAMKVVPEGEDWKTPANLTRIGQEFARQLIANPEKAEKVKAGFDNAGQIVNEVKDLSIREGVTLGIQAVDEVKTAFEEIAA